MPQQTGKESVHRRTVLKGVSVGAMGAVGTTGLVSARTVGAANDLEIVDSLTKCYIDSQGRLIEYHEFTLNRDPEIEWGLIHRYIDARTGEFITQEQAYSGSRQHDENIAVLAAPDGGWLSDRFDRPVVVDIGVRNNSTGEFIGIIPAVDHCYDLVLEMVGGQIEVMLDIKPGSDPNAINPNNRGDVPVAVLQTAEFDPTQQVDVSTLRFGAPDVVDGGGGATPAHSGHVEDVDNDGDADLVVHFPTQDTGFDGDESAGKLVGKTTDGTSLFGTDSVKIVGQ